MLLPDDLPEAVAGLVEKLGSSVFEGIYLARERGNLFISDYHPRRRVAAELDRALEYIRDGDTLVVTKLDRLARSVRDLLVMVDRVTTKGANLRILAKNLDATDATGRLMLQVLGAVGEFERALMLERQREGIAKAKAEGKYRGRKPTVRARKAEIKEMLKSGVGPAEASRRLRVARSSIYRIADNLKAK